MYNAIKYIWPFKVIQGHWFWYHQKRICDFLSVISSKLGAILQSFADTTTQRPKSIVSHLTSWIPVNIVKFLKHFLTKTRVLGQSDNDDFLILAFPLARDRQTDGQTKKRTDISTITNRPCAWLAMLTRCKTHEAAIVRTLMSTVANLWRLHSRSEPNKILQVEIGLTV